MRVKMLRTHVIEMRDERGWLQSKTYWNEGGEYNLDDAFGAELIESGAAAEVEQLEPPAPAPTPARNEWEEE